MGFRHWGFQIAAEEGKSTISRWSRALTRQGAFITRISTFSMRMNLTSVPIANFCHCSYQKNTRALRRTSPNGKIANCEIILLLAGIEPDTSILGARRRATPHR